MPHFHQSTPATVWTHFGITTEQAEAAGMNPKMFNSFVDGTKSSIEMAAVANATGLEPQARGLSFFPCGTHDLARVLRPESMGGQLERDGTVEVISDRERDGRHGPQRPAPGRLRHLPRADRLRGGLLRRNMASPSIRAARSQRSGGRSI